MTLPDAPEPDDPRALLHPQGAAECTAAALRLMEAARERVRILPQRADLRYLVDDAVIGALRALLLRNRRARLEILVPADVARDDQGRPLWNLAQRVTSAIAVHRLADADAQLTEAWLTVDDRGYLHRPQPDRLAAQVSLEQPPRARDLNQRFAALWLESAPDPDLRRLSL
jgi:hypothetical protein